MERQYWANAQCSRGECLEVVRVLDSVQNKELEDKVFTIFKITDCEVSLRNIEACYCHKKENYRVIFKFSRRKKSGQIISVKEIYNISKCGRFMPLPLHIVAEI